MHVRKHIQCSTLFSSKNKCFPLKVVKVNYRAKKSWLSPALKISIKTKKKAYKTFIKTFTNSIANKNIKRLLNTLVRRTERDHYSDLFNQHKNNTRKTWSVIKEVIDKKKTKVTPNKFVINNKIVTVTNVISDSFNYFYVNIGPDLAKNT